MRLEDAMAAIIDYRGKTPVKTTSGIPLVTAKIVKNGRILPADEYIASSDYDSWMRRGIPLAHDIVVTTEAPLGEVAQLDGRKVALAQRLIALRGKPAILDNTFLKFLMMSPAVQEELKARSTGTTVLGIKQSELRKVTLSLPPLPVQKRIADILGSLDDKIELNRKMNETLEAMARAIFKSWFVDFDPVVAKSEGRQPEGMDAETAKLFPDSFEDSEIGRIPKGWKVGRLDEVCEFALGGDWGKDSPDADNSLQALCVRGADIPNLQDGGTGNMPLRFLKGSSLAKRSLQGGDLVIEVSGGSPTQSTGRPVLVTEELLKRLGMPLVCSNFCRFIRLKDTRYSSFIFLWLRLLYDNDEFLQFENGTTGIKNFAYSTFCRTYPLLIPSSDTVESFNRIYSLLMAACQQHGQQNDAIAETRDVLLPKLLSGEVALPLKIPPKEG